MTEPQTEAGRDYARLGDLRDAIIEAVRTQDGVGGIKAFAAYEDFIEAEARHAALAEVRRGVEGLPWNPTGDYPTDPEWAVGEYRVAVLRILDAAEDPDHAG